VKGGVPNRPDMSEPLGDAGKTHVTHVATAI
jgi:hypothetical protein